MLSEAFEVPLANLDWKVKRDCCGLVTVRAVARASMRVESMMIVFVEFWTENVEGFTVINVAHRSGDCARQNSDVPHLVVPALTLSRETLNPYDLISVEKTLKETFRMG